MYKIGICDDNPIIIKILESYIKEYCLQNAIEQEIFTYTDARELIDNFTQTKIEVLFLDIEIGKYSGIKVAKVLKKYYQEIVIIFITSYHSFVRDAFHLKIFQYLEKPITKDVLFEELDAVFNEFNSKKNTYSVRFKGEISILSSNEVMYIESCGRYVYIHTINQDYKIISKLDVEFEKLDKEKFVRIHKSTIVNINFICKIEGNNLYIKNQPNSPISISRGYKENLSRIYSRYKIK